MEKNTKEIVCGAFRGRYKIDGIRQDGKMKTAGLTTQELELRSDEKSNTLTSVEKDNVIVEKPVNGNPASDGTIVVNNLNIEDVDIKQNYVQFDINNKRHNSQDQRIFYQNGKHGTLPSQGCESKTKIVEDMNSSNLTWRKLTPIECERLQTLTKNKKCIIIQLCLDHLKNLVRFVETKCPKLQKLVLNVEKKELKEYAKYVVSNIIKNQVSTKNIVQKNVDMQTPNQTKKCTKDNLKEKHLNVLNVENKKMFLYPDTEEGFVDSNVFINIIEGLIQNNGKVEFLQKEKKTQLLKNGNNVLKMYGKEIMLLVEYVEKNLNTLKDNNSIYTTLFHLHRKSIETTLITLYWFAKFAIIGYIQKKIKVKNILFHINIDDGHTAKGINEKNEIVDISSSQRYKLIGNSWTVDVICHIFKNLLKEDKEFESIFEF